MVIKSANLEDLLSLFRRADHRIFRALHYTNNRKIATILGPGPNKLYLGYYDSSQKVEEFDPLSVEWVYLGSLR
jgi:hypothetical protein